MNGPCPCFHPLGWSSAENRARQRAMLRRVNPWVPWVPPLGAPSGAPSGAPWLQKKTQKTQSRLRPKGPKLTLAELRRSAEALSPNAEMTNAQRIRDECTMRITDNRSVPNTGMARGLGKRESMESTGHPISRHPCGILVYSQKKWQFLAVWGDLT